MRPMGPLKAEEVRADHITVSWGKPKDNGGSDITGYIIEKMDMDSGRWVPAGEVNINILFNTKYFLSNKQYFRLDLRKNNSRLVI